MEPNTPPKRVKNIDRLAADINNSDNPDELFDVFAALVRALPAKNKRGKSKADELEKIQRYIDETKIRERDREAYDLFAREWTAIVKKVDIYDAVALAFYYGRAKGYRAGRSESNARTSKS